MAGGVVAALLGPNLANWTDSWLSAAPFAGSYLALTGIYGLSLAVLAFIHIPPVDGKKCTLGDLVVCAEAVAVAMIRATPRR